MPSSVTSSSQSIVAGERCRDEPDDIWTAAVHHKLDRHYTWEAVGRYDSPGRLLAGMIYVGGCCRVWFTWEVIGRYDLRGRLLAGMIHIGGCWRVWFTWEVIGGYDSHSHLLLALITHQQWRHLGLRQHRLFLVLSVSGQ